MMEGIEAGNIGFNIKIDYFCIFKQTKCHPMMSLYMTVNSGWRISV